MFLLVLCSVTVMSYSQDVINLTTKYVYDYYDQYTYTHRVSFRIDINSATLNITEEEKRINIDGTYKIVGSQEVWDNELGKIFHFKVEDKRFTPGNPQIRILTITKKSITFVLQSKNTNIDYLYLFNR